ncbi:MAG TPA: hypothetical protein VH186_07720 [Chloroflexia bacterium]|nr:hypothetical protein [Chloroflexia bacterium]
MVTDFTQLSDHEIVSMLTAIRRIYEADMHKYAINPHTLPDSYRDLRLALYRLEQLNQANKLNPGLYTSAGWSPEEITDALRYAAKFNRCKSG